MKRLAVLFALLIALLAPPPAQAQSSFNAHAVVNASSAGDNVVISGVALKRIYVYGFDITTATVTTVTLKSGASTALTGAMTLNAWTKPITPGQPYFVTAAGDSLIVNLGAATALAGVVWYTQQ